MTAKIPLSTADLCDEHGNEIDVCDTQLRQYGGRRTFSGAVVTLLCYEDNLLLKQVISEPGEGRVIVVDTTGSVRVAMLGDNMAMRAASNGWAGIVINGAVRDAAPLGTLPLGIKARGTNPRRSLKEGRGQRDVPVSFGGCTFLPGSTLVSDDDGIVVLRS